MARADLAHWPQRRRALAERGATHLNDNLATAGRSIRAAPNEERIRVDRVQKFAKMGDQVKSLEIADVTSAERRAREVGARTERLHRAPIGSNRAPCLRRLTIGNPGLAYPDDLSGMAHLQMLRLSCDGPAVKEFRSTLKVLPPQATIHSPWDILARAGEWLVD